MVTPGNFDLMVLAALSDEVITEQLPFFEDTIGIELGIPLACGPRVFKLAMDIDLISLDGDLVTVQSTSPHEEGAYY